MKRYEVVYTSDATYDLLGISASITSEFSDAVGAKRTVDRIVTKCDRLSLMPEISPVRFVVENRQIRLAHAGKFTIIYTIDKNEAKVIIYRIVGSRMDMGRLIGAEEV